MADVTLNIRHNASQAAPAVGQLANEMGRMATQSKSAATAGTAAANGFKKIGAACLSVGKSAKTGASGLSKFVSSLGRIAFYRAVRSAIRYVTDGFKQGLEAAYNWSKQQGGANAKLAGAMDALSAASGRMKLQLGAAFGGLIVAIEPVLTKLIQLVTDAAYAVTRFFAVLNGNGWYKKAVGGLEQTGNAAGGAGKQIKGLLASWDELNVIGKESGGGGSGSSSNSWTGDYEWVEAESDWATLFESGNFFGIGAKIGDALGEAAQKFTDFLKKPEIQNFGKNLADVLNGVVSDPENFSKLGEAAGTLVGTVVKNIKYFLENVNWEDVKEAFSAFAAGFKKGLEEALGEEFDTSKPYYQIAWEWFLNLEGVQRAVLSIKMLFNDIKISWLELKKNILEGMDEFPDWVKNGLGWVGFDISESLENTKQALSDAKEEADALAKSYDELNKKDVTVTVEAEVPNPVTPKDLFTPNSGVTSPSGTTLALGITPTIEPGTNLIIPSTANYTDWSVGGSKDKSKVSHFTTWNSTAQWNAQKTGSKWGGTTWNSTAQWNAQKIGAKWAGTTWDSTAFFKSYKVDDGLKSNGYMRISATADIKSVTGASVNFAQAAKGGLYKNGAWRPITSYASGGSPFGGQIFRARENGNPELVGTINGSTAVLNNGQIVASVSAGVARAISNIHFKMVGFGGASISSTPMDNEQIAQNIQNGIERGNEEQNDLLREQNNILLRLLQNGIQLNPSVAFGQVVARSTDLYARA